MADTRRKSDIAQLTELVRDIQHQLQSLRSMCELNFVGMPATLLQWAQMREQLPSRKPRKRKKVTRG